MEEIPRNKIVEEARKFKGVPFKHQGRSRKQGIDCVGMLIILGEENGFYKESLENNRYSKNPEVFKIKETLDEILVPIDKDKFKEGDILLFRIPFHPQHVGIVTDYSDQSYGIVQAYQTIGKVVEHRLDQKWIDRIVKAYQVPGVEE